MTATNRDTPVVPVNQNAPSFGGQDFTRLPAMLAFIKDNYTEQVLLTAGITQEEYDVVTGPTVWLRSQKSVVRKVLDAIMFAACDFVDVPRPEIPAEYVALVIGLFVNGCNRSAACGLYDSHSPAEHLAQVGDGRGTIDKRVGRTQLFALVTQYMVSGNAAEVQAERERIGKAFSISARKPVPPTQ